MTRTTRPSVLFATRARYFRHDWTRQLQNDRNASALFVSCSGTETAAAASAAATSSCVVRVSELAATLAVAGKSAVLRVGGRGVGIGSDLGAMPRSQFAASHEGSAQPALRCGRAPRPSIVPPLLPSQVGPPRPSNVLRIVWMRSTPPGFDGTRPYNAGRSCYMARRRYRRYPANPADELAGRRRKQATTCRSTKSKPSEPKSSEPKSF